MPAHPRYDELPVLPGIGVRHAWDVFGRDDQLGTLNQLTPDRVAAATATVRSGEVINLVLPLNQPDPPLYQREPVRHEVRATGRNTREDVVTLNTQGSSQWDGLRHVRCREFGFYGGRTEEPTAADDWLGVGAWVEHGFVGRGVLLDVAGHRPDLDPFAPVEVTADLLAETAAAQGTTLLPGDILCVRLGWERREDPGTVFAGLSAREETARFLWDHAIAAVACDNPAVEVSPGDPANGSLHRRLLPALGMPMGELFTFGRLAERCADLRRWEFLFVSVPLNLPAAVATPANAIAVL